MEIKYNSKSYLYEPGTSCAWYIIHKGRKVKVRSWHIRCELNRLMLIYVLTDSINSIINKYGFAISNEDEADLENKINLSKSITANVMFTKTK